MQVNKLLVLVALTAGFSASANAEWLRLADNAEQTIYIDIESIQKAGRFRRVTQLNELKESVAGMRSSTAQMEYDCQSKLGRAISLTNYTGSLATGKISYKSKEPTQWLPVMYVVTIFDYVCSR